ncbi:MAG: YcjF family protein [Prochlorococcaceae cyanobacterium]
MAELLSQWPRADAGRLLFPAGDAAANTGLEAVGQWLAREQERLRTATPRRCLDALHGQWQAQLEGLRRRQWRDLLRRTQWLVAAGVVAAPLPSLDLLVLAIANGLLLREMAQLWDCPWSAEQLRLAALEIGRAALAYGVVEWSSQALGAAIQLHGATWLVGGAISALSAAYLTRVIGQAMADVMALGAGVSAPDLERIKREAPLLVARAAAAEQLDWAGFLQQGRQWLERQPLLQATS